MLGYYGEVARPDPEAAAMPRILFAFTVILAGSATAPAQGIVGPFRPPISVGPHPAPPLVTFPVRPIFPVYPVVPGYPGYGFGGFGSTNWNPQPTQFEPPIVLPAVPPLQGAGGGAAVPPVLSGTQLATLAVTLPVPGFLWVDGVKQPGHGPNFAVTSGVLAPGQTHKFAVRAEWNLDGQRYGVDRTLTVTTGERQRLSLISGDRIPAK
ncbi:MAG: hypothetical protein ACRC7O_15785 [Fimbriiglobus sp.]